MYENLNLFRNVGLLESEQLDSIHENYVKFGLNLYEITDDITIATHWRSTSTGDKKELGSGVTDGILYELFRSNFSNEVYIWDDEKNLSKAFNFFEGEFLILEK